VLAPASPKTPIPALLIMGINLLFLRAAKRSFSFVAQYLLGKGKGKGKGKG
jgi:hypothetical protein